MCASGDVVIAMMEVRGVLCGFGVVAMRLIGVKRVGFVMLSLAVGGARLSLFLSQTKQCRNGLACIIRHSPGSKPKSRTVRDWDTNPSDSLRKGDMFLPSDQSLGAEDCPQDREITSLEAL